MAYGSVLTDVVQSSTAGAAPTFKDGNGTETGTLCRAWVQFGGGSSVTAGAIQGQFNVSSITVNGTGDYTINFTKAMPDATYSFIGTGSDTPTISSYIAAYYGYVTASSLRVQNLTTNSNTLASRPLISIAIFR